MDLIGLIIASIFTIFVLLYAFGDNRLFRLTIHIFIGVAAGYAGAIALTNVLIPQLKNLEFSQMIVPILLLAMLVLKLFPKTAVLGTPVSALLVGVGAAIAIGGAIRGTILPQITNVSNYFKSGFIQGILILIGSITTFMSFRFSATETKQQLSKSNGIYFWITSVGKVFIAITMGVIFAGVYSSAMTALVERFSFLSDVTHKILSIVSN